MSHIDYPEVAKKFGLHLAELRNNVGISQQKLAEEIEVDRTYISLLERGLRTPTLKRLWKISRTLNVSLSELVSF